MGSHGIGSALVFRRFPVVGLFPIPFEQQG